MAGFHHLGRAAAAVLLCLAVGACGEEGTTGASAPEPILVKEGSLTVCTSIPYEPFEFMQDGEPVGFDIDLAKEVAKELRLRPRIVNENFDALQSGKLLNGDKCDVAVAGMTITGDRARALDFSSPYFNAAQALVVSKVSGVTSLHDLAGSKIAVQSGTTGELYVTDNAAKGTEIVTLKDASDVDDALKEGEVAAGVYDNTVVGDVTTRLPGFEVAAEFDTGEQYGMAVKKNGNVELLRTINAVLADLDASGRYDAIYRKWFGNAPTE